MAGAYFGAVSRRHFWVAFKPPDPEPWFENGKGGKTANVIIINPKTTLVLHKFMQDRVANNANDNEIKKINTNSFIYSIKREELNIEKIFSYSLSRDVYLVMFFIKPFFMREAWIGYSEDQIIDSLKVLHGININNSLFIPQN